MAASPFYAPPLVDAEPLLFLRKKAESCVDVTEVAPQGAAGPVTAMSVPRGDVRVVWNVDALLRMVSILTAGAAARAKASPYVTSAEHRANVVPTGCLSGTRGSR